MRTPTVAERVGAEVRRVRKLREMTLVRLGKAVGLDPSQLSKIERGTGGTELVKLEKVAIELGVELASLFAESHSSESSLGRSPARNGSSGSTRSA